MFPRFFGGFKKYDQSSLHEPYGIYNYCYFEQDEQKIRLYQNLPYPSNELYQFIHSDGYYYNYAVYGTDEIITSLKRTEFKIPPDPYPYLARYVDSLNKVKVTAGYPFRFNKPGRDSSIINGNIDTVKKVEITPSNDGVYSFYVPLNFQLYCPTSISFSGDSLNASIQTQQVNFSLYYLESFGAYDSGNFRLTSCSPLFGYNYNTNPLSYYDVKNADDSFKQKGVCKFEQIDEWSESSDYIYPFPYSKAHGLNKDDIGYGDFVLKASGFYFCSDIDVLVYNPRFNIELPITGSYGTSNQPFISRKAMIRVDFE